MKELRLIIILFAITIYPIFGQDISETAFKSVIKGGFSTAPDYVVVKINNLNTGQEKEICIDAISLFEGIRIELQAEDYKDVTNLLLANSNNRIFEVSNSEAIQRLLFNEYSLKSEKEIDDIIIKENIIDSLSAIENYREYMMDRFYEYYDQREELIDQIRDSIAEKRLLDSEEEEILDDLTDQYYDYHYNEYAQISDRGKHLMSIWNTKVKPYQDSYKLVTDELERMEWMFFQQYYQKYGMNYCHVAFKYGAVFYQDCENGSTQFGRVVKE